MATDEMMGKKGESDIAIVGMACVFPKAPNLAAFWHNILRKLEAVDDPAPKSLIDRAYDPESRSNDRVYTKRGGYLDRLPPFPAAQFGIMPVAVDGAEPEHFMALKVAYDALVDAGYPQKPFNLERTEVILGRGTFVSRGLVTQLQHTLFMDQTINILGQIFPALKLEDLERIKKGLKDGLPPFSAETASGLPHCMMAGLVANRLNIKGRSYVLDAACASGLIALEIAVEDLILGKCDAALCGGVQISTTLPIHMIFAQLGATSRRGQLRAFDKKADGTILGEGLGIVVLKRLTDAMRDGHRIYAVIKGVGSSSDGKGMGLLAPSPDGEVLAMQQAYYRAQIDPISVSLVEAHGTGMPLGDKTEIQAMRRVFRNNEHHGRRIALGAVKTMIGHLLPAAGVAGLIKAALALYHQILPPTLHCEDPLEDLDESPFYINGETRPWVHTGLRGPRRAAVSAFGFGGINAHAVLEEPPLENATRIFVGQTTRESELFVITANSRMALLEKCTQILKVLEQNPHLNLLDVAGTLAAEKLAAARLAIVATSLEDLKTKIQTASERLKDSNRDRIQDRKGVFYFDKPLYPSGKVAFVFPGEGSQYSNMCRDLCLEFPVVRQAFDFLDQAYEELQEPNLPSLTIFPPNERERSKAEKRLWEIDLAVNSVLSAERGIYRLLTRLGIRSDGMVGHSSGELSALEASGAVVLRGNAHLLELMKRGTRTLKQLASAQTGFGRLLVVGAVERRVVDELVQREPEDLFVAMENCPHQVVLGGTEEAIQKARGYLQHLGALCQELPFHRAYHTPLFQKALGPLQDFIEQIPLQAPSTPLYSCMTASLFPDDTKKIREYAVNQWANRVCFESTIRAMYNDGYRLFIEVGPESHLTGFINDILGHVKGSFVAVSINRPAVTDMFQLHWALGLLAAHHVPIKLEALFKHRFDRMPTWNEVVAAKSSKSIPVEGYGIELQKDLPVPVVPSSIADSYRISVELNSHEIQQTEPKTTTMLRHAEGPQTFQALTSYDCAGSQEGEGCTDPPREHSQGVMDAYLATMEAFVDAQAEVMLRFLSQPMGLGSRIAISNKCRQRVKLHTVRSECRSSPAMPPESKPSGHRAPSPQYHQPESLQKELGKGMISEKDKRGMTPGEIQSLVFQVIGERTGYPIEMLELAQKFEADLGIDSIKKVEITGQILRKLPGVRWSSEQLNQTRTLQEFINLIIRALLPEQPSDKEKAPAADDKESPGAVAFRELPQGATKKLALWGDADIVHYEPEQCVCFRRAFSLEQDTYLLHHTLGGRVSKRHPTLTGLAIMPLTASLELCAEAASLLVSQKSVCGFENVRALRWIDFAQGERILEAKATRGQDADRVTVVLYLMEQSGTQKISAVECTVVFGHYAPSPLPRALFKVAEPIQPRLVGEKIYSEILFHGPLFQVLTDVEQFGADGLVVGVEMNERQKWLGRASPEGFFTDPVLLDSSGQGVGVWALNTLQDNPIPFPIGIKTLRMLGPPAQVPDRLWCQVRPKVEGMRIVSQVEFVDDAGNMWVQLDGLEHRRIHMPLLFYRFRGSREVFLSTAWSPKQITSAMGEGLSLAFLDAINWEFWSINGGIWANVLALIILCPKERSIWHAMAMNERRTIQWLLGRLIAKEAVRRLSKKKYDRDLWPADICVDVEPSGRPVLTEWPWSEVPAPLISISHSGTHPVAVAADSAEWRAVGVDVEQIETKSLKGEDLMFSKQELALVDSWCQAGIEEREVVLRCWCAKEAVGKMLGIGLSRGPRAMQVTKVDPVSGRIWVNVLQNSSGGTGAGNGETYIAQTVLENQLVAAVAALKS